jgi:hypothetical protein
MGKGARDEAKWLPSALPLWELHSCKSCECSKPWLERQTSTKLGPHDTIKKFLKYRCLSYPHIVHLNMICIHYDQKKGWESNWEFLENKGQMKFDWGVFYTIGKILLRVIRYFLLILKNLIWNRYKRPKFWDNKSLREKWHLDIIPMERHKLYYKERSGASSQRLRAV